MDKTASSSKVAQAHLARMPFPDVDGVADLSDRCRASVRDFRKNEAQLSKLQGRNIEKMSKPFLLMRSWMDLFPRKYSEARRAIEQAAREAEGGRCSEALQSLSVAEMLLSRKL
jgi:hypothetical protein